MTEKLRLELVVVPVSDVDRAKAFYVDQVGFNCDVDFAPNEHFRVVQLTPPGSACSITLMKNPEAAGSLQGLHLIVTDMQAARAELVGRGVDVTEPFHYAEGGQVPGLPEARGDFETFAHFADPDGTGWVMQEVPSRGDS
jgi:predicted enzyme related to lactoylglutathione lyase